MERQRSTGPRATRSKKSLPAAFSQSHSRLLSPQPPRVGEAGDAAAASGICASSVAAPGPEPVAQSAVVGPELPPHLSVGSAAPLPAGLEGELAAACGAPTADGERREAIRLDSLVFLSSCPQRHGHAVLKKMLHPPTLGLFCLVELPGADNQRAPLRAALQDWLRLWCALQTERPDLLVAVCETFWDAPQGYPMAILCEYMPLSLDELIQACGGLPEEAMREIAQAVLEALHALHSVQPPVVHGCLKPSQVLFSVDGRPRLAFGLEQRLKGYQAWSLGEQDVDGLGGVHFGEDGLQPQRASDGFVTPRAMATGSYAATMPSGGLEQQSAAVDIFDLGLLLLVSALGGMDVLLDSIPYAREFGSRSARGPSAPLSMVSPDTCALLQRELRVAATGGAHVTAGHGEAGMPGVGGDGSPAQGSDMGYLPPASDLLFNRRYSEPFLAFVSTCLEAHTRAAPVSASDLLQHEFLQQGAAAAGPLVTLREMQELARVVNEAPESQQHEWGRLGGPGRSHRSSGPGVVAQSAQLYLANIAQSLAPHCGPGGALPLPRLGGGRSRTVSEGAEAGLQHPQINMRFKEYETLIVDSARTLGLPRDVVQMALEAQLDRLLDGRERRDRGHSEIYA